MEVPGDSGIVIERAAVSWQRAGVVERAVVA